MPSDYDRAQNILSRARSIMTQRLIERVLECEEGILDDAQGDSFHGEIEQLFEQFGTRLSQLQTVMSHMTPPEHAPVATTADDEDEPDEVPSVRKVDPRLETQRVSTEDLRHRPLALPAPTEDGPAAEEAVPPEGELTFRDFLQTISSRDTEQGGHVLSELFDLSEVRGRQCAQHFLQQYEAQPEFLLRAMRLRRELRVGTANSVLLLLWECFGLQGVESLTVMRRLQDRVARTAVSEG